MPDQTTDTASVAPAPTPTVQPAKPVTVTPEPVSADAPTPLPAVTVQGEPNGLPPAAPGVQQEPPAAVIELREWFHKHIFNSVHSRDTAHYNELERLVGAIAAKLHAKYPVQS